MVSRRKPFVCIRFPVLSFETDYVGIVNNTEFIRFLERVRYALSQKYGFSFKQIRSWKLWTVLARVELNYRSPARFEDVLEAQGWVEEVGRSSMKLGYRFLLAEKKRLVADGYQVLVFINEKFKPVPVPAALRKKLGFPVDPRARLPVVARSAKRR